MYVTGSQVTRGESELIYSLSDYSIVVPASDWFRTDSITETDGSFVLRCSMCEQ
jgi:hypothetical protein